MIRIQLLNEGKVVKQITSRVHESVMLEQVKQFKDAFDTIQIVEGELSEDAKSVLQHVARKIIPAAMAAGVAMGGANANAQGGANPHYPGMDRSIGQHISNIVSPRYSEIQRQKKYEQETQRKEWDAQQNELRQGRVDAARSSGRASRGMTNYKLYDQSRISKDGNYFLIYGMDDKITRIPTAGTEFMAADSQRLAHYISPNGQVYYVRHPHNNGLGESVLDDVRARMDARRNPAAAKPAAQSATTTATAASTNDGLQVGAAVEFGVGAPNPKNLQQGTITAIQGPVYTVKTADGQTHELDSRMKSLYLAPVMVQMEASDFGTFGKQAHGQNRAAWAAKVEKQFPTAEIALTRTPNGPAKATLNGKVVASFPETQTIDEAGEWKDEAKDFREWSDHVKDELLSVDKSQRFSLAKQLSQIETKHFGNNPQTGFNAQTGRPDSTSTPGLTTTVKHIYDAIEAGTLKPAGGPGAGNTQQTPFGSVTRPEGQADPYHASPATQYGDRPAAAAALKPGTSSYDGGGSITILRTEEDWEEALGGKAKEPNWKEMLAFLALAVVKPEIRKLLVDKMKEDFGVTMSIKEVLRWIKHVATTPKEQTLSPAVWKFEQDGGDYETAVEQLPDEAVAVQPAEVMSAIATDLISAGVAEETPAGGEGAFGSMADQLTKKNESVTEAKSLHKRVKIVKGQHAGKYGWIREIKHGAYKGAPKTYYVDVEGGGQANNLSSSELRLAKEQTVAEAGPHGIHNMTPNWAKYVLDQIYNSNGSVTMTDLFDEHIPGLHAMFMATAQEHKLDPEEEFEEVQEEVLNQLEDIIKGGHGLDEASWINGRLQDPKELVWKQTSMSPEAAVAKFGKENVRVSPRALRNGSDMVEVHVPLGPVDEAIATIGTVGTIPASGASAMTKKTQFGQSGGTTDVKFNSKGQLELDDEIDPEAIDTLKKAGVEVAEAAGVSPELAAILDQYSDAYDEFKAGGDLTDNNEFYEALVNFFSDSNEMPYDVATSGDPAEWIADKLDQMSGAQPMGESDDEATSADIAGADKNIIMQLRRAADYEIPVPMTLGDGSSIKIDSQTANKMLAQFDKLKPESKALMQQTLNTAEGFREMLNYFNEREVQEDMQFIEQISNHMKPITEAKLRASNLIKSVFGK